MTVIVATSSLACQPYSPVFQLLRSLHHVEIGRPAVERPTHQQVVYSLNEIAQTNGIKKQLHFAAKLLSRLRPIYIEHLIGKKFSTPADCQWQTRAKQIIFWNIEAPQYPNYPSSGVVYRQSQLNKYH